MMRKLFLAVSLVLLLAPGAQAHKLQKASTPVTIGKSRMTVSPSRDWNGLGNRQGKWSEVWTIDGERLNELIFYVGVQDGAALAPKVKKVALPAWQQKTLLIELPELVENTWRATRGINDFTQLSSAPRTFLGHDGIAFEYRYVNADGLQIRGSAVATVIDGQLYMIALNAPRLNYYDRIKPAFDRVVASAAMK